MWSQHHSVKFPGNKQHHSPLQINNYGGQVMPQKVCALGYNAWLMPSWVPCLVARGCSYVDLVVPKALLHLVEQAAVGQLTEGRQVIVGSWRHQLDLRKMCKMQMLLCDKFKVWDSGPQLFRYCRTLFKSTSLPIDWPPLLNTLTVKLLCEINWRNEMPCSNAHNWKICVIYCLTRTYLVTFQTLLLNQILYDSNLSSFPALIAFVSYPASLPVEELLWKTNETVSKVITQHVMFQIKTRTSGPDDDEADLICNARSSIHLPKILQYISDDMTHTMDGPISTVILSDIHIILLTPGHLDIFALTMVFVVREHKNTRYLLKFAGSRAKRAIQDIVLGGLSAQDSTCLSEHSTLLQKTVPLWDRKTQRVPELVRTQQMEEQRAHDWMREKGKKRFRIWRVTITQQLCLLNCWPTGSWQVCWGRVNLHHSVGQWRVEERRGPTVSAASSPLHSAAYQRWALMQQCLVIWHKRQVRQHGNLLWDLKIRV